MWRHSNLPCGVYVHHTENHRGVWCRTIPRNTIGTAIFYVATEEQNEAELWEVIRLLLPMSSVGVFWMKCSHSLMNISVVSTAGHSPWLNHTQTPNKYHLSNSPEARRSPEYIQLGLRARHQIRLCLTFKQMKKASVLSDQLYVVLLYLCPLFTLDLQHLQIISEHYYRKCFQMNNCDWLHPK